jgi:hypothetical protein
MNTIKIKNIECKVIDYNPFIVTGILIETPTFTYKGFHFPIIRDGDIHIKEYINAIDEDRMIDVNGIEHQLFYTIRKNNKISYSDSRLFNMTLYWRTNIKFYEWQRFRQFNCYSQCIDYMHIYFNKYAKNPIFWN